MEFCGATVVFLALDGNISRECTKERSAWQTIARKTRFFEDPADDEEGATPLHRWLPEMNWGFGASRT